MPCYFDAGCGSIKILDPDSREARECRERMKDGEERIQDVIKDNWNQVKKNRKKDENDE
jgi:exonuclease VII small subunit